MCRQRRTRYSARRRWNGDCGAIIAQHATDFSLVLPASPAKPGETLIIYLAGLGAAANQPASGSPAPAPPTDPKIPATLTLNGSVVQPSFIGLTPGTVGLYQINFVVPDGTPDGSLTLGVAQSGVASNVTKFCRLNAENPGARRCYTPAPYGAGFPFCFGLRRRCCLAADYTLFQTPTVNQTHVVFAYAGDLWSVPRGGGQAQQLTSGTGVERNPYFSPDGKTIAFTGEYDGNVDVFTIPATGGIPKRLTWHPGADEVVKVDAGWIAHFVPGRRG